MSQARPDLDAIERDMHAALDTIRGLLPALREEDSPEENAVLAIECFCRVALETFRKVPANRIRAVARHFELVARLNGAEILNLQPSQPSQRTAP